jgi:hypothetical protein
MLRGHVSAERAGEAAGYRKTEPGTFGAVGAGGRARERFEDALFVAGRDAGAVVFDGQYDAIVLDARLDPDVAAARREAHGVLEHATEKASETPAVAADLRRSRLTHDDDVLHPSDGRDVRDRVGSIPPPTHPPGSWRCRRF